MSLLLDLEDGDLLVYDDTGYGVILTRAPRRRGARSYDAIAADWDRLETMWAREFAQLFKEEGDLVAHAIQASSRRFAKVLKPVEVRRDSLGDLLTRIFDKARFRKKVAARSDGPYRTTVDVALSDVAAQVGVGFDVGPGPEVERMITSRKNQLAGSVADSTYKQIKRALLHGIQEGDAVPDLVKRVQGAFASASRHRATMIARTEVVGAYNGGVYAGGQDLPDDVVTGQMWVATQDSRTRPAHRTADGQVVAKGDTFTVGGEELRYPGDPAGRAGNVINCRCALRLLTPYDDVIVPPPKRSAGPFVLTTNVTSLLTRVALSRLTCQEALTELRGDRPGHRFHGNQWSGGGGAGVGAAVDRYNAAGGYGGAGSDERTQVLMADLAKAHGVDGPPKVAPTESVLAGGDEGLSFRSHGNAEYAQAFKEGDYHPGVGMYGMGYYAQSATMVGGRGAALEKASSYGYVQEGGVTAQRLNPGAKVSTHTALEADAPAVARELGIDVHEGFLDPGVVAVHRGVDAYTGRRDNLIIVNRGAVTVGATDPRSSVDA